MDIFFDNWKNRYYCKFLKIISIKNQKKINLSSIEKTMAEAERHLDDFYDIKIGSNIKNRALKRYWNKNMKSNNKTRVLKYIKKF